MSAEPASWVLAAGDGVVLRVHVVPGASRAGVRGFHGEALRVRVRGVAVGAVRGRLG